MINENTLRLARRSLEARAEAMSNARFGPLVTCEFNFGHLVAGFARGEIQRWLSGENGVQPNGRAIYRISARTENGAEALVQSFAQVRGDADYALARRNHDHDGQTIYVGSSMEISSRLREHLQKAHVKTFALHLGRWCPAENHVLRVEVQAPEDDTQNEVLQDVEDALWDQYRPLFGRRGAK